MYPGITRYREEYVLPTTLEHGRIHLGLGCYIKSDNPNKDLRTLHNSTCQYWSILTLLTINKMHQLIDKKGMQDKIKCISSIYDSIYYIVEENPETIKWLNDNLVEVMVKDFMIDQIVKNTAVAEIGLNWSELIQIPYNTSTEKIKEVLAQLRAASGKV